MNTTKTILLCAAEAAAVIGRANELPQTDPAAGLAIASPSVGAQAAVETDVPLNVRLAAIHAADEKTAASLRNATPADAFRFFFDAVFKEGRIGGGLLAMPDSWQKRLRDAVAAGMTGIDPATHSAFMDLVRELNRFVSDGGIRGVTLPEPLRDRLVEIGKAGFPDGKTPDGDAARNEFAKEVLAHLLKRIPDAFGRESLKNGGSPAFWDDVVLSALADALLPDVMRENRDFECEFQDVDDNGSALVCIGRDDSIGPFTNLISAIRVDGAWTIGDDDFEVDAVFADFEKEIAGRIERLRLEEDDIETIRRMTDRLETINRSSNLTDRAGAIVRASGEIVLNARRRLAVVQSAATELHAELDSFHATCRVTRAGEDALQNPNGIVGLDFCDKEVPENDRLTEKEFSTLVRGLPDRLQALLADLDAATSAIHPEANVITCPPPVSAFAFGPLMYAGADGNCPTCVGIALEALVRIPVLERRLDEIRKIKAEELDYAGLIRLPTNPPQDKH